MKATCSPGKKTFTAMLNKPHSRREVLVGSAAAGAMVIVRGEPAAFVQRRPSPIMSERETCSPYVASRRRPAAIDTRQPQDGTVKKACIGPGSAQLFLLLRPPALILIAAPLSSRLSRYRKSSALSD